MAGSCRYGWPFTTLAEVLWEIRASKLIYDLVDRQNSIAKHSEKLK